MLSFDSSKRRAVGHRIATWRWVPVLLALLITSYSWWRTSALGPLGNRLDWHLSCVSMIEHASREIHELNSLGPAAAEVQPRYATLREDLRAHMLEAPLTDDRAPIARLVDRVPEHYSRSAGNLMLKGIADALLEINEATHDLHTELRQRLKLVPLLTLGALILAVAITFLLEFYARSRRQLLQLDLDRKLEAQLRDAQREESMTVLAGSVAHDFNNLLVGILGNADLVRERVSAESVEAECLEDIRDSARRCAELARKMLAYSGRGRFTAEPINLNAELLDTLQLTRLSLPPGCSVVRATAAELPAVMADRTQIRQVLLNLITNAIEAVPAEGGEITVRTEELTCPGNLDPSLYERLTPGRYVAVEVSDNGHGMDQATATRIFDPFFTTKGGSRGLGLAAAHGIVRSHGGALEVRSAPGKGATFRLLLPASDEDAPAAVAAEHDTSVLGGGTVLLIDDEPTSRATSQRMLDRLGFLVDQAEDGLRAVELFEGDPRRYACVVVDLHMPGLDGHSTLARMREKRERLPAVVISGCDPSRAHTSEDLRTKFLPKPFDLSSLRSALSSVLLD